MTQIRDRNGNLTTLSYENPGTLGQADDTNKHRLLQVLDPIGRPATIAYPASGMLASCTSITYTQKTWQICQEPLGTLTEIENTFAADGQTLPQPNWLVMADRFHLRTGRRYRTRAEAAEVLDTPAEPRELRRLIGLYQRVLKGRA